MVELVDVTSGTPVADWMKIGDVPTPAGGMRTNAAGEWVVNGLPRGSYRCVVTSSAGAVVEKTLEVPAQATGELEVVLP
ncbi:MAG: hypothetical protein IPJ19_15620 [Planctomycetes bacterium]|nr:hypothetical protein [Planctomycetota bacterium]